MQFQPLTNKIVLGLIFFGLLAMFAGSFLYRMDNPTLVKQIGQSRTNQNSSDFGDQNGMNTGMNPEMMAHISELMGKLREDPNSYPVRVELATHFMEAEDWGSASSHLLKAKAINPEETEADYYLGICYYNLNEFAKAAESFEAVLSKTKEHHAQLNLALLYRKHLNQVEKSDALLKDIINSPDAEQELKTMAKQALDTPLDQIQKQQ